MPQKRRSEREGEHPHLAVVDKDALTEQIAADQGSNALRPEQVARDDRNRADDEVLGRSAGDGDPHVVLIGLMPCGSARRRVYRCRTRRRQAERGHHRRVDRRATRASVNKSPDVL